MATVPQTSVTLLQQLACDSQHARWGEFVSRYEPMMRAFMRERFPTLEADDVIQDTLVALIRSFPLYHYVPDEKGSFHNYLTGILSHKAHKMLSKLSYRSTMNVEYARESVRAETPEEASDKAWRDSIFEIALQQYMADETLNARTRQIFSYVAIRGEKPEAVAKIFGVERNAVDQIKGRGISRLRELVKALERIDV